MGFEIRGERGKNRGRGGLLGERGSASCRGVIPTGLSAVASRARSGSPTSARTPAMPSRGPIALFSMSIGKLGNYHV